MRKIIRERINFIEFIISLVIFVTIVLNNPTLTIINFSNVIYLMLSFIVILEIVKMVREYVINSYILLQSLLDTFFVFTLRETILAYTNHSLIKNIELFSVGNMTVTINEKLFYILLGIFVMGILMYFRKGVESSDLTKLEKLKNEVD